MTFNRTSFQRNYLIYLAFLCCALLPLHSFAASKHAKAAAKPVSKPALVLLPLRVDEQDRYLQASLEVALVQGLQNKYTVFSGSQVEQKAREVFSRESRTAKGECDETRCMEDIAVAFQSELIASASVNRVEHGYLLALSIRNVFDNKVVVSNSLPCENCNSFDLVNKLKELDGSGAPAGNPTPAPVFNQTIENLPVVSASGVSAPETALWNEIRNSSQLEDYQIYLRQYPKGKYLPLAKRRIKQLQAAGEQESQRQEFLLWSAAEKSAAEADYQRYLNAYPQGNYAGLAQIRLRKFSPSAPVDQAENAQWQEANSGNSIAAVQAYLDRYPNGQYVDAAKARIKQLQKDIPPATQTPKPALSAPSSAARSSADRLHEAEAAGREREEENRRVIVLPPILKKLEPANKELEWVLPFPIRSSPESR